MAFISEVNFRGGGALSDGEFVEITLGPDDDPADFVVSVYRDTGVLNTGAGIAGGEVTLSSLTGTPDPDNADYTIYVIPVGIKNANSDSNEGSGIALTDTSAGGGVVDFYSAETIAPIAATEGAASGATSSAVLDHFAISDGESYQWDIYGNSINGPITSGDAVLCVSSEAKILTKIGAVESRNLKEGDLVWTLDHDYQPIRWIGSRSLSAADLIKNPKSRPICVHQNAIGDNMPARDILLSPQHRVLGRSKVAEHMFGTKEVLVAATKLKELVGVETVEASTSVQYIHILFDHHEIIKADGLLVESLLIAEQSEMLIEGLDQEIVPERCRGATMIPARPLIEGKRCKTLIKRILKNKKSFFTGSTKQFDLAPTG